MTITLTAETVYVAAVNTAPELAASGATAGLSSTLRC